uniref:Uncharacterized protein n=1 Tax=Anopheles culicifacies TaxID=139723 RepID=A0A182LXX0_9DIPT
MPARPHAIASYVRADDEATAAVSFSAFALCFALRLLYGRSPRTRRANGWLADWLVGWFVRWELVRAVKQENSAHTERLKLMATLAAIGKIASARALRTNERTTDQYHQQQAVLNKKQQRDSRRMVRETLTPYPPSIALPSVFALFVLCVPRSRSVVGRCARCSVFGALCYAPSSTPQHTKGSGTVGQWARLPVVKI